MKTLRMWGMFLGVYLACVSGAQAADEILWAAAEFTPRDISPKDGVADVFVGGDPETYRYLFIKAGTEDRACAEYDLATVPSCALAVAELRFFIRTLDDGVTPADPIELKRYEANGVPDLVDFDPPDGVLVTVFDGPIEDPFNPEVCPSVYGEQVLDVTDAFHAAMVGGWDHLGFVWRDTVATPGSHRFDLYSNTWNCQPPSECCEESYVTLRLTYVTPGDVDVDGGIDLDDFNIFAGCQSGPGIVLGEGCGLSDLNCTGDTDMADAALFQASISGSNP